jgi:hypothetical protein
VAVIEVDIEEWSEETITVSQTTGSENEMVNIYSECSLNINGQNVLCDIKTYLGMFTDHSERRISQPVG